MKTLKYTAIGLFARLTGNLVVQKIFSVGVSTTQYFMGIGSGSSPSSSGEMEVLKVVKGRLGPKERFCLFDVGANRGQFLSILIKVFGIGDAEVHVFEPGTTAFALLGDRYKGTPSVHLNNVGLGDRQGARSLYSDIDGSGMSSLIERDVRHLGRTFSRHESVQVITLDAYADERKITRIDLLKMDVEGAELDVLNGGSRLFGAGRIRSVLFEFGGSNIDSKTYIRDFYNFFKAFKDVRIYRITPSGYLFPISSYTESLEAFRTTNFFVILDSSVRI